MKTPRFHMLMKRLFIALILFLLHTAITAQTSWYQNQDGQMQPNGTYATAIQPFGNNTFIASYLWTIDNDQYTWKISKTTYNGQELKKFFITGTTALLDIKPGNSGSVYALLRDFPVGQNPVYTVYKLNSNLQVVKQKVISFPNGFNIYNLSIFEMDESDNLFFGGDGQYPGNEGFYPASFLVKTDRNLFMKWSKMDSTETSYTSLLVEESGKVVLIEDYYLTFPDVRVSRYGTNGQLLQRKMVATDPGRVSMIAKLDEQDNLLFCGVNTNSAGEQGMYIRKLAKQHYVPIYHKVHFNSPGLALNDIQIDKNNAIYSLVTKYDVSGEPTSRVSRINASNGHITWNRSIPFAEDSCVLSKIVMNQHEKFYVIGERRSQLYYSKGFALRIRKGGGQRDGSFASPDSVSFQRTHVLLGGVIDHDDRLIAMGNTNDFDTNTYSSSYFRAFAARLSNAPQGGGGNGCDRPGVESVVAIEEEKEPAPASLTVYPNPASNEVFVSNLEAGANNQLTVYNIQGVPVMRMNTSSGTARLNISKLSAGAYIVRVQPGAGKAEQTLQFIIRR